MLDHLKDKKCIVIDNNKSSVWKVKSSQIAKNCKNLIRNIVDNLTLEPNPQKTVIALSIGDPTVYGNFGPSSETIEAIKTALDNGCFGYAPCVGHESARKAVASYLSHNGAEIEFTDVILCSGCSGALDICITVLADSSKNILAPRPGFSIYQTIAESIGAKVKFYNLLPEKNWEIDLGHLESKIDENTVAIILNNPSNPCGSVYGKEHLRKFLALALKHQLPVIADEVYERIVFPESGKSFVSVASFESGVPILVCGGLAKRFLVPGWRMGWIVVHDGNGAFDPDVRKGLINLSQKIIGSNTLIQCALPAILHNTPQIFHDQIVESVWSNAKVAFENLKLAKGLLPFMPEGSIYMMVAIQLNKFPMCKTDSEFVQKLMKEESVFCLPGHCFQISGFMRIVLTVPGPMLHEACLRIIEFCKRNFVR